MKKLACVIFELEDDESLVNLEETLNKYFKGEICYIYGKSNALDEIAQKIECDEDTHAGGATWKERARCILNKLGLTPHMMGYDMIIHMLEPMSENPTKAELGYLKQSYSHAAKVMGKTAMGIERGVRLAIEKICEYNTNEEMAAIMGLPVNDNMKITNSTFIALLSQVVFKRI